MSALKAMKFPLYERVALLKDFSEEGLQAGDIVTTVDYLKSPKPGVPDGYYVEAFNALGKTIAVFIVFEQDIEALTERDILQVRHNLPPLETIVVLDEESTEEPLAASIAPVNAITIKLSDAVLKQKGTSIDEAKLELALLLFQQDFFSLGKASELAGLHSSIFQKELAKRRIPVHYDIEDYQQDVDALSSQKNSLPTYQGL